jgi:protein TonB
MLVVLLVACRRDVSTSSGGSALSSPREKTRAEAEQSETALRVGGDVQAPVLIYKVEPQLHPGTRRIAGVIVLEVVVTKNGTVRDLKIIKGEKDPMAPNVIAAVGQWRFRPATQHGKPVDVIDSVSSIIDVR